TTPAAGAFSVSQTANLTATLSEAVRGVTGTNFQLRLGATLVPAAVSYNPLTKVATLNPNGNLTADRVYRVTVSGISDLAGNTMVTTSWSFTTGPAPTITGTTPVPGATAVRRNSNVTARFSEAITGFAVAGKVRINLVSTGAPVTAVVSFDPLTRVLTINPNASLASNIQYRVTITGGTTGVRDLAGNPLTTRTWTFTTGSAL
ncbi:Ig-like domain-containing protein, partial [Pseudarthrobacter albicanus]|uniref:Ig-like domain-containing protein n=1 Tax=Pseudarthrobacter albicanus TaxID=2823873 RepID=UPI001BA65EF4